MVEMVNNAKLRSWPVFLLVILIALSGCSVLTPTQVKEVKKFAAATENYAILPGAVTDAYGELRKRERLYSAASISVASVSMKQIEGALKSERDAKARAQRADKALNVLNTYAPLLVVLSSDKFTNTLDEPTFIITVGKASSINLPTTLSAAPCIASCITIYCLLPAVA